MSLENIIVKTNCVIWRNIHLPHPRQSHKSPVFTFNGFSWYFDISCYWQRKHHDNPPEEAWQFNIRYAKEAKFLDSHIIIPYADTEGKYVLLASTISNTFIWRSSLSNIITIDENIITVLFCFLPDSYSKTSLSLDLKDVAVETSENDAEVMSECLEGLSEDIVQLFNNDGYADAILKYGKQSFFVHKNILAARSAVFSSMFERHTSEKDPIVVEIVDILDQDILEQFLLYLYSGKIKLLCVEKAIELYKIAEKYSISSLKLLCVSYILDNLSIETICKVLLLADQIGDAEFLDSASSFAAKIESLLKSTEWEEFAVKYPTLAVKVFFKYLNTH